MNRLDHNLSELSLLQNHMDQMPPHSDSRYSLIFSRMHSCHKHLSSLKSSCERYCHRASGPVHQNLPSTVGAVQKILKSGFEESRNDIEALLALIDSVTHGDVDSVTTSNEASVDKFKVVSGLVLHNPENIILDFDSKDDNGEPITCEGKLMKALLEGSSTGTVGAIACGLGGVGKTCALREIDNIAEKEMKTRFRGGVVYMTIGQDARENDFIEHTAYAVEIGGGVGKAQKIRDEKDLNK